MKLNWLKFVKTKILRCESQRKLDIKLFLVSNPTMKRNIKIRKSHGLMSSQIEGGKKPKYSRKSKHKKSW